MHFWDLIISLLNPLEFDQYFKNPENKCMRINGQHSDINIGLTRRLIFKYQKLIRKFLKLFWISINFNWKYFHYNIRVGKNHFAFQDKLTLLEHLHEFFPIRTYLGLQAHNKFKIIDLFISINLCFKP